ncbi:hypothetical protein K438DRAFT_1773720 [Mycena galopus ATCC 62051]|nr:hypothetical protein K438DRAFT_1773720 [Mycena galopus ATCC 62051]
MPAGWDLALITITTLKIESDGQRYLTYILDNRLGLSVENIRLAIKSCRVWGPLSYLTSGNQSLTDSAAKCIYRQQWMGSGFPRTFGRAAAVKDSSVMPNTSFLSFLISQLERHPFIDRSEQLLYPPEAASASRFRRPPSNRVDQRSSGMIQPTGMIQFPRLTHSFIIHSLQPMLAQPPSASSSGGDVFDDSYAFYHSLQKWRCRGIRPDGTQSVEDFQVHLYHIYAVALQEDKFESFKVRAPWRSILRREVVLAHRDWITFELLQILSVKARHLDAVRITI